MPKGDAPRLKLGGARVTVMGLGLHGGGAAAARFCAGRGARVTVTDLQPEEKLAGSIEALADLPIRFVLGRHEPEDFTGADIVVKNPAVPRNARYLAMAERVETDISLFLRECALPIIAVTGTKGKSTTASAIHYGLTRAGYRSYLGGNITISPLTFLDEINEAPDAAPGPAEGGSRRVVVLEISSFQLGDLLLTPHPDLFKPGVSVITNIFEDHQDYYGSMEAYVADKRIIYRFQDRGDTFIYNTDDAYGPGFAAEAAAEPRGVRTLGVSSRELPAGVAGGQLSAGGGVFIGDDGRHEALLPRELAVAGSHMRVNLLTAALALHACGVDANGAGRAVAGFTGIPHRLERIGAVKGVAFVNDSAATIPDAASRAVDSFSTPVYLIAGGSDKNGSFDGFPAIIAAAARTYLLEGAGTDRILDLAGTGATEGPFTSLREAVHAAFRDASAAPDHSVRHDPTAGNDRSVGAGGNARAGGNAGSDRAVVLLSPGCASFGMFRNEFDRGRQFVDIVKEIIAGSGDARDTRGKRGPRGG